MLQSEEDFALCKIVISRVFKTCMTFETGDSKHSTTLNQQARLGHHDVVVSL